MVYNEINKALSELQFYIIILYYLYKILKNLNHAIPYRSLL